MPLPPSTSGAEMIVVQVDPDRPAPEAIARAVEVVRRGGLVAFPTETVYGLGADALDPAAVARVFAAKGRPAYNPIIAHVRDLAGARRLSSAWPDLAETAGAAFWPGPLTLVVPRAPIVPDIVTAGLETVAIRIPAHPVALALLEACGIPLAAPSANRFTEISPTTAAHVAKGLGDRIDMILDAGPTQVGIESTVLDLSGGGPVLLRPGSIPIEALERVVGSVRPAPRVVDGSARPSPGMMERHYSPRADLRVFPREARERMLAAVAQARGAGSTVGGLLLHDEPTGVDHPVEMPAAPAAYARELYAALHRLDEAGCDLIVADDVPDAPEWAGVRDRLERAGRRG